MRYQLDYHNIEKLPEQSLAVIQCGYQRCFSAHHSPPRLYPQYSVTFIIRGKGSCTIGNQTYHLQAGQGFLILPGMLTQYTANADDPWHYIYALFNGIDSEALIRNAGLDAGNVTFDFRMEEMLGDLQAMYESSITNKARGYDVTGRFLIVMSHLICDASERRHHDSSSDNYLDRAVSYIEDHYPYNITVQDIADAVRIDRTYLYKLFKARLNISPNQYLNDRRLTRAKELILHTSMTVSEIALSVGFYDLSHFNRVFTAKLGITPGQYRKSIDSEI